MDYTDILIPLRQITRSIHLESKRTQKEYGLSIPQLLTLTYMSRSENFESTQLEVRKFLQLNSSTMTGIVGRLQAKGFIAKIPSKGDKRSTRLTLTASGKKAIDEAPPVYQERIVMKLSSLSEKEIHTIIEGLQLLVNVMGIDPKQAVPPSE